MHLPLLPLSTFHPLHLKGETLAAPSASCLLGHGRVSVAVLIFFLTQADERKQHFSMKSE